ncbi:SDR family NAD(P)-dependent oxidoreductase [Cupriavidus sp. amp6]|uniref:SDR family NAD(P)-dependent oxidoreductase n=1 Tax=Cupriavidus sp. amp6 TaxID=388051 RepID=UPI0004178671|nr:glucose 1-dehydrogenase [Cupriavidus sp. amp6]
MELKDKVAIVTGGGRGAGEGIARVMAREGARLAVVDLNLENARRVANSIDPTGTRAIAIHADVSRKADAEAMVAETMRAFGTVDILVNNAGIEGPPVLLQDLAEEQWDRVMGVNAKGVLLCCQAVLPTMIARMRGKIVNIDSIAGIRMTFFGSIDYTASKHAVTGLTRHLAWEVADHGINVNAVCPGGILTPLMEQSTRPEMRDAIVKRVVPLGRFCKIEEIGEAASFLSSERANMITGQLLAVDGGVLTGYGEDLRSVLRQRMEDRNALEH